MTYWQIALLITVGVTVGFVLSAKLASRYYIGVGLAIVLHAYVKVALDLEMKDQLDIIAERVSEELGTEEGFDAIYRAARKTVMGAMFE